MRRFIALLAGFALASGLFLLAPAIADAQDEDMGFSDSMAVKLISPQSDIIPVIVAIGGIMGIVVLGLVLAYGRKRGKA